MSKPAIVPDAGKSHRPWRQRCSVFPPRGGSDLQSSFDGAAIRLAKDEVCGGEKKKKEADEAYQLGTGSRDEASERHCLPRLTWL